MKSKIFATRNQAIEVDLTLLLVRLICGIAFILHGMGKIQNPMQWMGSDSPVPGALQLLAAVSEFGGGIALILGLLTRLAAFGIACTMVVAVIMHVFIKGDPFVSQTGGGSYELAAVFLSIALLILVGGPGRFSLDRKIFGAR
jgi:putative oxidoreductase